MTFERLNLSKEILHAIEEQGYTAPTEIQSRVIPLVLQEKDILGGAQTGTGKTASFMLPLLHLLAENPPEKKTRNPRVLILVPTRELAAQVYANARTYGKHLHLKTAVVFGGIRMHSQVSKLKRGIDILIATPGRLIDHVKQKTIDLSSVERLVLDEADCMLDMGFIHDIRKIISFLPEKRQTLMFSATFSGAIQKLAEDLLTAPEIVQVAKTNAVAKQVKQVIHPVDRARKPEMLQHLIKEHNWEQVLVFTRTKYSADLLCDTLKKEKIRTDAIHGDKRQSARSKALMNFKKGKTRILVATDIAARGLDIHQLSHVVNYELPTVASDYIHRIGRTGRAGNIGEAISLVSRDEGRLMGEIESLIQKKLDRIPLEGFEVTELPKPSRFRKKPQGRRPGSFNAKGPRKEGARKEGSRKEGARFNSLSKKRFSKPPRREKRS